MKRSLILLIGVCLLLICQVVWWVVSFYRLNTLVTRANLISQPLAKTQILEEAFHRNVMIFSESFFFMGLTCFGVFLLYRAYRRESASKERQKEFLQLFSHESKTPLTSIKLYLEKLKNQFPAHKHIEAALFEVRRLNQLFEKIVSLFRTEEKTLVKEVFDLSEVIQKSVESLKYFFDQNHVELDFNLKGKSFFILGDFFSVQVAIQNILENAVLHNTRLDKKLLLDLKRESWAVSLSISDNGEGISAEEKDLIFNKFYRGKKSGRVQGSGLGLYISKKIIEAHNGELRLQSPNTFQITIPEKQE